MPLHTPQQCCAIKSIIITALAQAFCQLAACLLGTCQIHLRVLTKMLTMCIPTSGRRHTTISKDGCQQCIAGLASGAASSNAGNGREILCVRG